MPEATAAPRTRRVRPSAPGPTAGPAPSPAALPADALPRRGVLRVALLDLNAGVANQGMRCLREILDASDGRFAGVSVLWDEFDVRTDGRLPGLDYDVYLSSGGPGSPHEAPGTPWGDAYAAWLDALWTYNQRPDVRAGDVPPKYAFFICYSFELLVAHFGLATLALRRSESFGIFPVHKTDAGRLDPLLGGVDEPFYGADFRSWQAIQPDVPRLEALGGSVLAIEKDRPHVELERAVMALRLGEAFVATQFHPEADPDGMLLHFRSDARKADIVARHGAEKYARILHLIAHPDFLLRTYAALLPDFLRTATQRTQAWARANAPRA